MLKKVFTAVLVLFLTAPGVALAKNTPEKLMVLPQDQVIKGDYFAAGDVVEISGTVNGDVYAAGGTILVDGVVNGDLIVAGGTITISGQVSQDLRAAGGQITILGKVGRNATLLAGNVDLVEGSAIAGSLTTAAGNVAINSAVGSIEAAVGKLRLAGQAKVAGPINYTSEEEVSVSETASVSGNINRRQAPEFMASKPAAEEINKFFKGMGVMAFITSVVSSLILGLLAVRYLPNYTKNTAKLITEKFATSFGIGLIGLIVTPIIIIILLATIVGIPLSILLAVVFVICLYVARIFAMIAIGVKVSEWLKLKTNSYWVFVLGLSVYYLLSLIPIVDGIVKFVVLVVGFGAALMNKKAAWVSASKAKIL